MKKRRWWTTLAKGDTSPPKNQEEEVADGATVRVTTVEEAAPDIETKGDEREQGLGTGEEANNEATDEASKDTGSLLMFYNVPY